MENEAFELKKRIGKFKINISFVESDPEIIMKLMGSCIVVRCEFMYEAGYFEYTAISQDFKPVSFGGTVPEYEIIIQDGQSISFKPVLNRFAYSDEIIIVYGRQGIGKTRNSAYLMGRYLSRNLIDDWDGAKELEPGDMAITNLQPPFNVPGALLIDFEKYVESLTER